MNPADVLLNIVYTTTTYLLRTYLTYYNINIILE